MLKRLSRRNEISPQQI